MSTSRTIHALVARLRLPDEDYRAMLWDRYQSASSKDLTATQANDLVAALHALLPAAERVAHPRPLIAAGARKRFESLGDREDMATPKQLRMLEANWVARSRAVDLAAKQAAFREWIRNRGIERVEWIPRDQVGRLLRAIHAVDPGATPRPRKRPSKTHQIPFKGACT